MCIKKTLQADQVCMCCDVKGFYHWKISPYILYEGWNNSASYKALKHVLGAGRG